MSKAPITLTDAAKERVAKLLSKAPEGTTALRVGVDEKGCSGLAYVVEYAENANDTDVQLEAGENKVLITAEASLVLYGSVMDYVEEDLYQGFKFDNPNAKGTCGCGESFHI